MNLGMLGRLPFPDERDKMFALRPRRIEYPRRRLWNAPGALDQGNTPQCVAYACTKYALAGPITNKPATPPAEIYRRAQLVDEWPGEDYEGTSVRAGFKVLKELGILSEYRWAFDLETTLSHLLGVGPVVVGTNWYMDMFTPDRWGYIWPFGSIAGGHAWCLVGADRDRANPDGTKGAVRMVNSWGQGWAERGRAWVAFKVLERLINEDGEAGVGVELKHG